MINLIKKKVIEKLKDDQIRLKHVFGVYETALKLAKHYKLDEEKIAIASLFHDYTKNDDLSFYKKVLSKEMIETYQAFPVMYHALSAALILQNEYHIDDAEILNPIINHIWGRPHMSMYEKVVFVSDYAEPNRKFFDPHRIFDVAMKDLDLAVLMCMNLTLKYLEKLDMKPSQGQIEAYHYYMEVNSGKTQ